MDLDWVRGERLGHGSFATVSLAVSKSLSKSLPPVMAVKSCGVSHSSSLEHEKIILDELHGCPEIIRCFDDSFSWEHGERLYNVLLEYASGGSLADKLRSTDGGRFPEHDVRRYTKSLLRGLGYVHRSGYVHCDLKLENMLVCRNGVVKIGDFGLAKRGGGVGENGVVSGCELRGTPMYMSPEMVAGGEQGAAADVWALGCAVAEMVAGEPVWGWVGDVAAVLMRIGVGDQVPAVPLDLSEEGRDFLNKCFVRDPRERWTAEMLLNHPFVCGVDDRDFDGGDDDDDIVVRKKATTSTSPRCPFEFAATCSITSLPSSPGCFRESGLWFTEEAAVSAVERVRTLVCERASDWSVADDWVTVR